jgi:H+-translocating NAD(P) transhydrogenase subunit alpha
MPNLIPMTTPHPAGFGLAGPVLVASAPVAEAASPPLLAAALVAPPAASGAHAAPRTEVTSQEYVATLFVFMLATFVGLDVIRRVSRLLHTPLMSLTNAISAIAVVGSLLIAGQQHGADWNWINLLGLVAIVASVTNIVSGFLITDRMLKMFKRREAKKP